MGLDSERALGAVNFLEAYADMSVQELNDINDLASSIEPTVGHASPLSQEPTYSFAADAASAYREAAQWCLYVDPERTRSLLGRSGRMFHLMGQPFGLFLRVLADDPEIGPPERVFQPALHAMVFGRSDDERLRRESAFWEPATRYPQQQLYLLLSASVHRGLLDSFPDALETSPHSDGTTPVGALGTPIRRLWSVAADLYRRDPDAGPRRITSHLASMCMHYEEAMLLARANTYLWDNAAAPVDIGDIDIAGVAVISARVFGTDAIEEAMYDIHGSAQSDRTRELGISPLALAPFEAGLEYVRRFERGVER